MEREPYPIQDSGVISLASSLGPSQNRGFKLSETSTFADTLFSHKVLLEEYLTDLTFSDEPRFADLLRAMRYSLLVGGERMRPVLCMEVASCFSRDPAEVLPSAAAIELIYTFSLIHYHLPALNEDALRRGMAACHEEFGEATAILAGDGFFGESLALITVHQRGSPEQLTSVVRELARAAGVDGMVGGQTLYVDRKGRAVDPETLMTMHDRKTGALIEASARIGAILAGATSEEREIISEYARQLGICFQVANEALNAAPATGIPGKNRGSETVREKATFGQVYGPSEAQRLAEESYEGALEALKQINVDTAGLAELARLVHQGDQ